MIGDKPVNVVSSTAHRPFLKATGNCRDGPIEGSISVVTNIDEQKLEKKHCLHPNQLD